MDELRAQLGAKWPVHYAVHNSKHKGVYEVRSDAQLLDVTTAQPPPKFIEDEGELEFVALRIKVRAAVRDWSERFFSFLVC